MSPRRAADVFEAASGVGGPDGLARRVLEVMEAISRGRVMAYGDIGGAGGDGAASGGEGDGAVGRVDMARARWSEE